MFELDMEARAALAKQARREIRRKMRALRQALPASAIAERSARIVERVMALEAFQSARSVALFWPIVSRGEVDLVGLDLRARAANKQVFYPFMDPTPDGHRTGFRRVANPHELADRGNGFAEPGAGLPQAARGDVELVIVPALAVAENGHRLGYGAGFYDATLPDVCPPAQSVAVAFSFQLLAELPPNDTDIPCNWVVTDERTIGPTG